MAHTANGREGAKVCLGVRFNSPYLILAILFISSLPPACCAKRRKLIHFSPLAIDNELLPPIQQESPTRCAVCPLFCIQ
jgi:hypothetical protein